MSGDIGRATREAALAAADARGCIVIEPEANQLFIDIDSEADHEYYLKAVNRVRARTPAIETVTPSPSGTAGRFHIVLTFPERTFTQIERVAWQSALGSDRMRETNSLIDILDGDPLPTIFFEKKPC